MAAPGQGGAATEPEIVSAHEPHGLPLPVPVDVPVPVVELVDVAVLVDVVVLVVVPPDVVVPLDVVTDPPPAPLVVCVGSKTTLPPHEATAITTSTATAPDVCLTDIHTAYHVDVQPRDDRNQRSAHFRIALTCGVEDRPGGEPSGMQGSSP